MKNIMTPEMEKFIKKAQEEMSKLYEEYSEIDLEGVEYTCPLTNIMMEIEEFSCLDLKDTINEEKDI